MEKAMGMLQLMIAGLLMAIKTSDSSYITCYDCTFESTDASASDVCSKPSANSDKVSKCVGLNCKHTITICTGNDDQCGGSTRISVTRSCVNETVEGDHCIPQAYGEGHRKSSECVCKTNMCNGGYETRKSVCSVKFVSSVVLVTMVFAQHFGSSMIYN